MFCQNVNTFSCLVVDLRSLRARYARVGVGGGGGGGGGGGAGGGGVVTSFATAPQREASGEALNNLLQTCFQSSRNLPPRN